MRIGAFMEGVEAFDSDAFRLPHAEAAAMDPQARLLLELAQARRPIAAPSPPPSPSP